MRLKNMKNFKYLNEAKKHEEFQVFNMEGGPLCKKIDTRDKIYVRDSNKKVALKCLHNSQESIDSLINEAKKYSMKHKALQVLDANKKVALKYLHNSQNSVDILINKVRNYLTNMFDRKNRGIYGISQDSNTNDYILVLKWVSGNGKIDGFIMEMQLNSKNNPLFKWIPYGQFDKIKEISKNNSITIYSADPIDSLINEVKKYSASKFETSKNSLVTIHSAVWRDGPLHYHHGGYTRDSNKEVALKYLHNSENSIDFLINKAKKYSTKYGDTNKIIALKCLHNSQNINNKFLNEIENFPINKRSNNLSIYGISQNPNTKEYIIVFKYAKKGNFNNWINKNYECFNWHDKLSVLDNIICGLEEIHQKKYIHHDFHTGNILFLREKIYNFGNSISISDMGLFGEVGNEDETKIYGVMPYVAPEVLRGKLYTQAADIYSLENKEIEVQFNEAEKYRKSNLSSIKNYQAATHPQAIYVSRLLNPFTKDLSKYNDNSECLDCKV
ncbi:kinase-like domain-containing protein [Rhizophagus irregularis DAOM 181602=DAOM 197198]|nr:kinase-like domain-containing protein [Rhizophagus irregularis DAOM 181602=DAOM 197198]